MAKQENRDLWVIKSAVGSLFKAVTLSTDPAMTLGYEASLINTSRASLIQKLESRVPDSVAVPSAMKEVLRVIITNWTDEGLDKEGYEMMDDRICKIFKDSSIARYGLEAYRDALFTEDLHKRWMVANDLYIQSPASWAQSNAMLAQINKQLMEIIVRHDLMVFPKGEIFSMDQHGSNFGRLMKDIQDKDSGVEA